MTGTGRTRSTARRLGAPCLGLALLCALAAVASGFGHRWDLWGYVPQAVFERFSGDSVEELAETCAPSLVELIRESKSPQFVLDFEKPDRERLADQVTAFVDADTFEKLPLRDRKAIEHAVQLFHMQEEKALPFAPVFQPLLGRIDDAAEALLLGRLSADVPAESAKQKDFFEPDMSGGKARDAKFYLERARTAKRLLVHRNPIMPTGLLVFCLRYAAKDTTPAPGIFSTIRARMSDLGKTNMLELIEESYNFRNTYIAHEKTNQLTDVDQTRQALGQWVEMLTMLHASVETAR